MSDTIKNVRLKDRTGNILHPEISVDMELNILSDKPIANKTVTKVSNSIGFLSFDTEDDKNTYLSNDNFKHGQMCVLDNKKYVAGEKLVTEHTEQITIETGNKKIYSASGELLSELTRWTKIPKYTNQFNMTYSNGPDSVTSTLCLCKLREDGNFELTSEILYGMRGVNGTASQDIEITDNEATYMSLDTSIQSNSTFTVGDHYINAWLEYQENNITVDTELNDTSENPVQNKVVKAALDAAYNPTNKEDLNKIGHDEKGNLTYNEVVVGGNSITVDSELSDTSENPVQNKVINAKLDEVFQSVSNGKNLLETAITDMGGTVSKAGDIATYNEIKKGLSTLSLTQANLFVQENEPETKYGLWLKTSNSYDDIIDIKSSGDTITYTKMTNIPYSFKSGSAVAIGNDIYILGGSDNIRKYNYKYDTTTDTYTQMTNIPYEFYNGSATSIGTDIYILGSDLYNTSYAKNNYKYDTLTDTYTRRAYIPYNFSYGSSVSIGTDIYLLGGSAYKKYNYKYDTTTNTYTKMTDIPYDFSSGSAVAIGSDIYLLGWTSDGKYDTTTNTYTKMTDIPYTFNQGSATSIGTDIYILGSGYNTNSVYPYTKYNYKYNILSDTYIKMTDLPYGFYKGNIATVNNKIYMLGGEVSLNYNYRIDFTILDKNSIIFLNADMPIKHKTKMFNTPYGVLNYINFDSVIMTDENGNNANVEVYIGNGTEWTKISA